MASRQPFDLQRFVDAQAGVFDTALAELRAGRKRSHWMWFVFPQMRGLGHSSMAQWYGIASREQAQAYLAHPLLGTRLIEATRAVLRHRHAGAHAIFGSPDDLKFRSSMTLFAQIDLEGPFSEAIDAFYDGVEDEATIGLLEQAQGRGEGPVR